MSEKKKSLKQIKLRHIIGLAINFALLYILINGISIWNYGKLDEKCSADVAIVLGAGTQNDEVTPVFRERLNHGIWLYENGYVKKLILTGGYGEGNEHSDAYVAQMYVEEQGVPAADIRIEETSTITQENIENAKAIMDDENYTTAILVSDPLHMKRSMLMAEDYGIEAYSSPTPTTRYISLKSKLPFLARELFFYVGYKVYRLFPDETVEDSDTYFSGIIENRTPKENLILLFDYLYPDKENMTEITLCDENNELYYKYKFVFPTNEISDPCVLHYIDTTEDGLYHHFGLYGEVWETVYEEGEERREHTHNSYSNYWYLNTENKKIIPMWIYDSDAEDDASYCIDNEEYFKIAEKY